MNFTKDFRQWLMVEAALKFIPISVFFELTYQCNLKCIHCYISEKYRKAQLSTSEIKSLLDQSKKLGCLYIYFSGGEPLIKNDFIEIFKYARRKGFIVSVYTNATLISDKIIEILKEFGVYEVHVSLYSMDPKIHDKITQIKGSFKKTIKNINKMIKEGITVVIKCPLTKLNVKGYKKLLKWAENKKLSCVLTPYITAKNDGDKKTYQLRLDDKSLTEVIKDPRVDPFVNSEMNEHQDGYLVHTQDKTNSIPCFAGYNSLAINPFGDIFPCIQFLYKIGNIRKNTLKDIWNDSQELKKIRSIKIEQLTECIGCRMRRFCARCPGLALIEDNDLYGKSSFECRLANIRKRIYNKKRKEIINESL